jgi:hypothetical protein
VFNYFDRMEGGTTVPIIREDGTEDPWVRKTVGGVPVQRAVVARSECPVLGYKWRRIDAKGILRQSISITSTTTPSASGFHKMGEKAAGFRA